MILLLVAFLLGGIIFWIFIIIKKYLKKINVEIGLRTKKDQPLFGYFSDYYDAVYWHAIWILFFYIAWET